MASSSSASNSTKEWKYDVFLSFRGRDTRNHFTSHLYSALCRNNITTFIDDKLTRGEEIISALLKTIEDSRIAVIVFSEDYGSSTNCLDEVTKIIECYEIHGQIVIPVFYDVDPLDVENQTGSFETAFMQHENEIYSFDRVQGWKEALSKASSMAGWDSKVTCPDSKLVDNIVDDILVKLNKEWFSDLEGLVGIHYRLMEIKNLLLLALPDVRWGMGGIGKTTIAEAVFKQIARQFEGCCFLENVKDAHEKHGVYHLRKELLFQVPDSKLVDNIVDDILVKLNKECFSDLEGLVGIHSRIKEIKNLLLLESPEVRLLGIWGMGGIGKTTIAEAVFKQIARQFEGCCFLENVKDAHEKHGVYHLRKELLFQVSGEKDFNIGTNVVLAGSPLVRRMLRKKILLVVDDASSLEQLEFFLDNRHMFGKGSRIIITSRDKQILVRCDDIYEIKGLEYWEALNLFSEKAFKESSSADYWDLSYSFVKYANGNPLAIKVLGSSLYGKTKKQWNSALDKLKEAPNTKILASLKISYDSLDEDEQKIFLYVACFFKGEKRNKVTRILEGCGFRAEIGLSVLVDKSLITVLTSYDYISIGMHDLLQDMGKEIARRGYRSEPGKWSLLWHHEDIVEVLKENTGTETIEGILLDMSKIDEEMDLKHSDIFKGMHNLKLLKLFYGNRFAKDGKVKLSGGLEYLPNKLRHLYWDAYPLDILPANFQPQNLVELRLPNSKIKELPIGVTSLKNLKTIDLPDCIHLIEVAELSGAKSLVHINLSGCPKIRRFPSTRALMSLETLNLRNCFELKTLSEVSMNISWLPLDGTKIEELPTSFGTLHKMGFIEMSDCTKLKSLPSGIYNLKSLWGICLIRCSSLEKLPEISETVYGLCSLQIHGAGIVELPSSIGNIKNLRRLYLANCKNLTLLPETLSNLNSLEHIDLIGCMKLEALPDLPRNIISLDLRKIAIEELPASLENLHRLEKIHLENCTELKSLPAGFCKLKSLECIFLSGCSNLQQFPEILETMDRLVTLVLDKTGIVKLPSSIENLRSLGGLCLENCKNLTRLPETLSNLQSLSWIELSGCPKLEKIPENLKVSWRLDANGCLLSSLSNLSSLSSIKVLILSDNRFETLPESIKQLSRLESLNVSFCDRLVSLPDFPPSLKEIDATECRSLVTIPSPAHFFYLESAIFGNCFNLNPKLREHLPKFRRHKMMYPGNEIPVWFPFKNMGNSIQIPTLSQCFNGVIVCLVIAFWDDYHLCPDKGYVIKYAGSHVRFTFGRKPTYMGSEHVLLFSCVNVSYGPKEFAMEFNLRILGPDEDDVLTKTLKEDSGFKVTKCGVLPFVVNDRTRLSTFVFSPILKGKKDCGFKDSEDYFDKYYEDDSEDGEDSSENEAACIPFTEDDSEKEESDDNSDEEYEDDSENEECDDNSDTEEYEDDSENEEYYKDDSED